MTKLDELFSRHMESLPPQVRKWKALHPDMATSATVEVSLPASEFGQSQPEINLHFTKEGKPLPPETVPWDDALNTGLVQLGVRSINMSFEARRVALALRAAMRNASRQVGDGYFNAVLVEYLTELGPDLHTDLAGIIEQIAVSPLAPESKASDRFTTCRDLIDDAITGRAHELTDQLHYSQVDAKMILILALYIYLDDRFSVSYTPRG